MQINPSKFRSGILEDVSRFYFICQYFVLYSCFTAKLAIATSLYAGPGDHIRVFGARGALGVARNQS